MITFQFYFKENHVFVDEEDNPLGKIIIAEEQLNCVDEDGIGNANDLPGLVFIDEKWENLKVVVDG